MLAFQYFWMCRLLFAPCFVASWHEIFLRFGECTVAEKIPLDDDDDETTGSRPHPLEGDVVVEFSVAKVRLSTSIIHPMANVSYLSLLISLSTTTTTTDSGLHTSFTHLIKKYLSF